MSATNDSNDLEALFDSIAADFSPAKPVAPPVAPPPIPVASVAPPVRTINQLGDSDDLQALFDSVSAESQPAVAVSPTLPVVQGAGAEEWPRQEVVFNQIGNMARVLHDTLSQLGYEKLIEQTVSALPDAKDRLAYVANLTEQAACRVLNATDIANPLVDDIENASKALGARWDKVFANQLGPDDFKRLAEETRIFLNRDLPQKTKATHAQLTEIMMAQDFQDLTGQVIKKIVSLAQTLEAGLMNVLVEVLPETRRTVEVTNLMNGPVVNSEGRTDVVVNQEQVDDLLDSLGF
jgi:chemotaxis protein CheZ